VTVTTEVAGGVAVGGVASTVGGSSWVDTVADVFGVAAGAVCAAAEAVAAGVVAAVAG